MSNQVDDYMKLQKGIGSGRCNHEYHIRGCPGDCWKRTKESSMDMINAPMAKAAKQPEMERVIDALNGEVERLQSVVGALSARLGPVLSPGNPTEVRADIESMGSLHADKINNYAYAIGDQTQILNDLLHRLEV